MGHSTGPQSGRGQALSTESSARASGSASQSRLAWRRRCSGTRSCVPAQAGTHRGQASGPPPGKFAKARSWLYGGGPAPHSAHEDSGPWPLVGEGCICSHCFTSAAATAWPQAHSCSHILYVKAVACSGVIQSPPYIPTLPPSTPSHSLCATDWCPERLVLFRPRVLLPGWLLPSFLLRTSTCPSRPSSSASPLAALPLSEFPQAHTCTSQDQALQGRTSTNFH